jgi:hypothetical protein
VKQIKEHRTVCLAPRLDVYWELVNKIVEISNLR